MWSIECAICATQVVFSSCILYNNYVTIQQRRLAAQLEEEQRQRIIMVDELKVAVKSKDEFIYVIGHELRTPLSAIIQLSSALSRGMATSKADGTQRSWLDTITRSATHLLGIINDIITLRAARSGMSMKQARERSPLPLDPAPSLPSTDLFHAFRRSSCSPATSWTTCSGR